MFNLQKFHYEVNFFWVKFFQSFATIFVFCNFIAGCKVLMQALQTFQLYGHQKTGWKLVKMIPPLANLYYLSFLTSFSWYNIVCLSFPCSTFLPICNKPSIKSFHHFLLCFHSWCILKNISFSTITFSSLFASYLSFYLSFYQTANLPFFSI